MYSEQIALKALTGQRRGWLRNGNRPGDFMKALRCGARTRRGTRCQCPAMQNGRCRLHGGLSTGPKTAQGIERIQRAVTKHGQYSREVIELTRQLRPLIRSAIMEFRARYKRP